MSPIYRLQDHKPPPKMPGKPAVIPKRRPAPMVESDMVPRYLLEEKEQEVLSRDETVQVSVDVCDHSVTFSQISLLQCGAYSTAAEA